MNDAFILIFEFASLFSVIILLAVLAILYPENVYKIKGKLYPYRIL
jgi:hypothetical protein